MGAVGVVGRPAIGGFVWIRRLARSVVVCARTGIWRLSGVWWCDFGLEVRMAGDRVRALWQRQ